MRVCRAVPHACHHGIPLEFLPQSITGFVSSDWRVHSLNCHHPVDCNKVRARNKVFLPTAGLAGFSNCCRMKESGVAAASSSAFATAPFMPLAGSASKQETGMFQGLNLPAHAMWRRLDAYDSLLWPSRGGQHANRLDGPPWLNGTDNVCFSVGYARSSKKSSTQTAPFHATAFLWHVRGQLQVDDARPSQEPAQAL